MVLGSNFCELADQRSNSGQPASPSAPLIAMPMRTQLWFLAWNVFGLLVYALYSRRNAVLGRGK